MGAELVLGKDSLSNTRLEIRMVCDSCGIESVDLPNFSWHWKEIDGVIIKSMLLCVECVLLYPELDKTLLTSILMARGYADFTKLGLRIKE